MSGDDFTKARHSPSGRDWETHRKEMTLLYLQHRYTLDEVVKHMQDKYGFQASLRQYQERFRQWKVRKYITGAVRQEMKSQQSRGGLLIDPDAKRRLDRQIKAHPERKLTSSSSAYSESPVLIDTPSSTDISPPSTSLVGIGSVTESSTQPWPASLTQSTSAYNSSEGQDIPDVLITDTEPQRLSISPPLARSMSPSDNAEEIFFHLRQFCQHYIAKPILSNADEEASSTVSNAVVQRSTNDLKDIIYLYKIGNFSRADNFLQTYCSLPFEFVIDESVDFLRQVITTLAPINTTRRPAVRHRLLEHLYNLTNVKLGPWHPFTVICRRFRLDQDSLEISMRSLQVLQNSVMIWSRLMSFKTELDLIAMMRRERNYDNAMRKTLLLIDTSTMVFGVGSIPVRKAQLELSRIYIAQQAYDAGIRVCRDICLNHRDMLAVRAMENLAEIHRLRSEINPSLIWLETAADLVVEVEGNPVATTHILDKMFDTLTAAGSPDVAQKLQFYSEKYREYL